MRILTYLVFVLLFSNTLNAQTKTYCNPINIDYGYCPIPNFVEQGKHRATADPVITVFKGNYYLFSTNQWGYWWSADMVKWNFVPRKFLKPWNKVYDELCAPATIVLGDTLLVIGSTYEKNFPLRTGNESVNGSLAIQKAFRSETRSFTPPESITIAL